MTGRLLADVNALAIRLVSDHPGHRYVEQCLSSALSGDDVLLLFDYLPLRVQWVLTTKWGIESVVARNAVTSLLNQPSEFASASRETVLRAYEISAAKNHDVYDSFYVSLAREHDVNTVVSTDRDFERLCADEPFDHVNPVPEDVLSSFHRFEGS